MNKVLGVRFDAFTMEKVIVILVVVLNCSVVSLASFGLRSMLPVSSVQ